MTIPSVLWPKSEGGGCECDEGLNGNETPGFNLESDCLRAESPGAGVDWESRSMRTIGVCMCARLCVSTSVSAYSVYMMGWDPGGSSAMWRWPLRRRGGGRGHLLAGGGEMRVTAIHLSENTLIPDPICPPPLGYLLPRGPCDPRCRPLDQASCPLSLRPAKTATAHLRPEAILRHCNTVQYIGGCAADVCSFTVSPFLVLKWYRPPGLMCQTAICLVAWLSHHRWPTGKAFICSLSHPLRCSPNWKLIMVFCSTDNRWPTTEQFGNSNNGHI